MIVDLDDFHETNHRLDLLHQLKDTNPLFRCTLFAVPGLGSDRFWESVPDWCELAVHGWLHPDPYECAGWTYERMQQAIDEKPGRFVNGFKAPGWQISDGCYAALLDNGWWVADQHLEDGRRPRGLPVYFYEDGNDRWHGHIQDVCGNGLQERWGELVGRVAAATEFRVCSQAVGQRADPDDPRPGEAAGRGGVERSRADA